MKFLFDSNVFIEAKNRYYALDICPGFWDWIDHAVQSEVGSVDMVCAELCGGDDAFADWIEKRKGHAWFLKVDDEPTQAIFASVAEHVSSAGYHEAAVSKFLSGADPWLIAKAKLIGAIVVTHEVPAPAAKARVPIPNVCTQFGVRYMNTFDAIRQITGSFTFTP